MANKLLDHFKVFYLFTWLSPLNLQFCGAYDGIDLNHNDLTRDFIWNCVFWLQNLCQPLEIRSGRTNVEWNKLQQQYRSERNMHLRLKWNIGFFYLGLMMLSTVQNDHIEAAHTHRERESSRVFTQNKHIEGLLCLVLSALVATINEQPLSIHLRCCCCCFFSFLFSFKVHFFPLLSRSSERIQRYYYAKWGQWLSLAVAVISQINTLFCWLST